MENDELEIVFTIEQLRVIRDALKERVLHLDNKEI